MTTVEEHYQNVLDSLKQKELILNSDVSTVDLMTVRNRYSILLGLVENYMYWEGIMIKCGKTITFNATPFIDYLRKLHERLESQEKISDFEKSREIFNSWTENTQWMWAIENKDKITLQLDNDRTSFTFNDEDKTDNCTICFFKADIGDRSGIEFLLAAIGIKAETV